MQFKHVAMAASLFAGLAVSACGGNDNTSEEAPAGEPRAFMMGISSLPRELNAQAYADTFELAGEAGEMILIQRTPPWTEFLPGGAVSDATADTTAAEIQAVQDEDLTLFFAIDPTDAATGRDRIGGLPASHEGRGFDDPDVRAAFASYAEYVAINYQPRYLALGVEINLYLGQDEERITAFESLYAETYARVKAVASATQVTVTFQYEDLQSILPTEDRHFADWPLIERFEPNMDVAAISTYPGFAFERAADIPENYYSQLLGFTEKPIVIAEMGFASAPSPPASNGTEEEQAAFVKRALAEAEELRMPFVIWFAAWDPAYAEGTAFNVFRHIGLLRSDGAQKPSWAEWHSAALRPVQTESSH